MASIRPSAWVCASLFLLYARSASAEVLDKISMPWEWPLWIPCLIVLGLCVFVAWATRNRRKFRLLALGPAIYWAALRLLVLDDYFCGDLSRYVQIELDAAHLTHRYLACLATQAFLPLLATVLVSLSFLCRRALRAH